MFYNQGVGTSSFDHLLGGAFGVGLSQRIKDAYLFIIETFAVDDELFLFGFSRGAYTARSLAGLIRNSGVLRSQYASRLDDAYELYRDRSDVTHPRSTQAQLFRATATNRASDLSACGTPWVRLAFQICRCQCRPKSARAGNSTTSS
jgi:uncharacterized protein (DUF2235 family)